MNLIIDNGGTKAIWVFVEEEKIVKSFTTKGIYPPHSKDAALKSYFDDTYQQHHYPLEQVFFYSTGCRPEKQKSRLLRLLNQSFGHSSSVEVQTDLLAAARALCGSQSGIACIMGTGSNSCLYDGDQVISNRGGFGFILGDEGSGAVIGKSLLIHFLNQTLPKDLSDLMIDAFAISVEEILLNVYQNESPNKYLASFAPFVSKHRAHPFVAQMLLDQFADFFEKYIIVYPAHKKLPIHFLGSISYYFQEELKLAAAKQGLIIQSFIQDPMPGLIKYHAP